MSAPRRRRSRPGRRRQRRVAAAIVLVGACAMIVTVVISLTLPDGVGSTGAGTPAPANVKLAHSQPALLPTATVTPTVTGGSGQVASAVIRAAVPSKAPPPVAHIVPSSTRARTQPPAPSVSPSRIPASASAAAVVVTEADNGATVPLRLGQRLVVDLSAGSWTEPAAADGAVLRRDSGSGTVGGGTARATFTAAGVGNTEVTAQTDLACLHSTPRCLPPQRLFVVHVTARR